MINEPCLTLARVGSAGAINFYTKCYIGDKAKALILNKKYINFKNKYVYIFLKTILNSNKYRYSYGKGVVAEKYLKNKIILPIDTNGNPDWKFMENYIKLLPFSKYL